MPQRKIIVRVAACCGLAMIVGAGAAQAQNAQQNYSDLPTYTYNSQLDPGQAPPVGRLSPQPTLPRRPYMGLETRSGVDLGLQLGDYQYREPDLGVTLSGPNFGATAAAMVVLPYQFFLTADGRATIGWFDYDGSGTADGNQNEQFDVRALFGKDFLFQQVSLSPYIGVGYRYLFDDDRGASSTGALGYRRENQLYYIPIGVHPRLHIGPNSRFTSTLEYDFLLHGQETSFLGDPGFGDPSIHNEQSSGYGLRGDFMYETRSWSFGPYFTYWNIDTSNGKAFNSPSGLTCGATTCIGTEPFNHTLEAGVQFKYHLF